MITLHEVYPTEIIFSINKEEKSGQVDSYIEKRALMYCPAYFSSESFEPCWQWIQKPGCVFSMIPMDLSLIFLQLINPFKNINVTVRKRKHDRA